MPAIGSDDAGGQETQGQHVVQGLRAVQGSLQNGRKQGYCDQRIKRPEAPRSKTCGLQEQEPGGPDPGGILGRRRRLPGGI